MTQGQKFVKRAFDLLGALVGLVVLLPVMGVVALWVRLTSPGPALFVQTRVGRKGTPFRCVKFRSMRTDSVDASTITVEGDPRITGVGRVLRRTKLDELPQLWNVLLGRMSFVGPRPDVPGYADRLTGEDRRVLALRPGITGPATLFYRNEEELLAKAVNPAEYNDQVIYPTKVRLNLAYLDSWSFWRDVGYIVVTMVPVLDRLLKVVPQDAVESLRSDVGGPI